MLDRLDDIPWASLTHAYGSAADVPDQIRALTSKSTEEREQALWDLCGNVFHQGSRYEATPFVVPFLYELLANNSTPAKRDIIYFLVHLALGYEEYYLPDGIDEQALTNELNEADGGVAAKCYHAVRAGASQLLELLEYEDDSVRRAAVYALAWFPTEARRSIPAIQHLLADYFGVDDSATALLALGLLGRNCDVGFDEYQIRSFLTSPFPLLSTCAAIALAGEEMEMDLIEILVRALSLTDDLAASAAEIPFNEGDIVGYAGISLARYGTSAREITIPALCLALQSAPIMRSLDLTKALLDIIFSGKDRTQSFDELEREALLTIATHGAWKIENAVFANYSSLIRSYGLPDTSDGLKEFASSR